jgi:hypothetical protein
MDENEDQLEITEVESDGNQKTDKNSKDQLIHDNKQLGVQEVNSGFFSVIQDLIIARCSFKFRQNTR